MSFAPQVLFFQIVPDFFVKTRLVDLLQAILGGWVGTPPNNPLSDAIHGCTDTRDPRDPITVVLKCSPFKGLRGLQSVVHFVCAIAALSHLFFD